MCENNAHFVFFYKKTRFVFQTMHISFCRDYWAFFDETV